jgi:uncharacterized protein DUF4388
VTELNSAEAHTTESSTMSRSTNGFRAHLKGLSLHDLVMLQNLVRATGVFVVLSGARSGCLHFAGGQLYHAETVNLTGDAAALAILSWREGEFISSERSIAERSSVTSSLESLLLGLMQDADEGRYSEAPMTTVTGIRRRVDGSPASERPELLPGTTAADAPPESARNLAAAATPGTAALAPRFATRAGEARGVTNVLVTPRGQLVDGNGADTEALASRVAYVARLAELIGQAMGSGETRALKVRAAHAELCIRRHADGHVSGSLGPPDLSIESSPPPLPRAAPASVRTPTLRISRTP